MQFFEFCARFIERNETHHPDGIVGSSCRVAGNPWTTWTLGAGHRWLCSEFRHPCSWRRFADGPQPPRSGESHSEFLKRNKTRSAWTSQDGERHFRWTRLHDLINLGHRAIYAALGAQMETAVWNVSHCLNNPFEQQSLEERGSSLHALRVLLSESMSLPSPLTSVVILGHSRSFSIVRNVELTHEAAWIGESEFINKYHQKFFHLLTKFYRLPFDYHRRTKNEEHLTLAWLSIWFSQILSRVALDSRYVNLSPFLDVDVNFESTPRLLNEKLKQKSNLTCNFHLAAS